MGSDNLKTFDLWPKWQRLLKLMKRGQVTIYIILGIVVLALIGVVLYFGSESFRKLIEDKKIPVYCPAIMDGSLGDMIHFFMYEHPDFKIDIAKDIHDLNEFTITRKKTGVILLGKGIMKHHILNSNMMRNGADYSVYINTGEEWDGADSNARPDEAVSWGKIKKDSESIKVFGDATILFPLLVAKSLV